jgi:hypothetical protein
METKEEVFLIFLFLPHSLPFLSNDGHSNKRKRKILLHSTCRMSPNEACIALSKIYVYFSYVNILLSCQYTPEGFTFHSRAE